jgi:hypothetical protein
MANSIIDELLYWEYELNHQRYLVERLTEIRAPKQILSGAKRCLYICEQHYNLAKSMADTELDNELDSILAA